MAHNFRHNCQKSTKANWVQSALDRAQFQTNMSIVALVVVAPDLHLTGGRHETGVDLGEANVLITESIKRNEYDGMLQVVGFLF